MFTNKDVKKVERGKLNKLIAYTTNWEVTRKKQIFHKFRNFFV